MRDKWGCGQLLDWRQADKDHRESSYIVAKACRPCVRGELTHSAAWVIGTWEDVLKRQIRKAVDRDNQLTSDEAMEVVRARRELGVRVARSGLVSHCGRCPYEERHHVGEARICPTGLKSAKTFMPLGALA